MPRHVAAVAELVRIPSVSSSPARAGEVRRAASWLASRLRATGMAVSVLPTAGHPAVVASWRRGGGRPCVLVYGHYDVQPAGDGWTSPPFAAVVRDGRLHGRGASDDKGQLLAHLAALQSWLAATRTLPVDVVCLFEGEEEIGSPHLEALLRAHRDLLGADVAVLSDTSMPSPLQPAITYALRGLVTCEVSVDCAAHDNHSGTYGGAIANPLHVLGSLIASLHDARGRIAVAGLYESVGELGDAERDRLRRDGPADARMLRDSGASRGWGEPGWTLFERSVARPSLSVTGIAGGHAGPGVKGVVPGRAVAKISVRLVPGQQPREVVDLLRAHLSRVAVPAGARVGMRVLACAPPVEVDPRHPAIRAAGNACVRGFGRAPVLLRSGGTIPAVHLFREHLGIPTVLLGFGLRDDRIHAADESLDLRTFARGVVTSVHLLDRLAAALPRLRSRRAVVSTPMRGALVAPGHLPWEMSP
jgi:acetylornithine deacetylase/succinyl-diaminopimelate desuccinylase-like protein